MDHRRLLKPIGAVPGDVVTVSSEGISVNGHLLANTIQLIHDGPGHVLPRVASGRYLVAPGTVWLISQYNPISLDSRYFGPVPVADLINEAMPIFVHQGLPNDEAAAQAAVRQMIQAQQASMGSRYIEADLGARHAH
jgi:type IV secretory pathway protease TraF